MARVLVTEAQLRHPLAVIRSLGRKGISVTGVDKSRVAPGFFSKYCKKKVVCTDPCKDSKRFIRELFREVKFGRYDVLMGLGHDTIFHISEHRKLFEKYVKVPIVKHSKLIRANNKAEVMKLAKKLGVPIPKTYFDKKNVLNFPAIIKPVSGSGSRGVVLVKNKSELAEKFKEISDEFGECIIQEYIPKGGDAFGVSVLFDYDSKCKAIFTHRRLREYPISGGPSVLRESVAYPEIEKYSIKLMEKLGWFGLAMLEFKVDPRDGKPKLMEINGRLWGSLPLAVNAGVDFPYLLYKLVTQGKVSKVSGYKLGVKCRWVLPGDILYFLSVKEKLKFLPELFNSRREKIYDDVIVFDDLGPVLGTLLSMVSGMFNKETRKYVFRKKLV